MSSPIKSDALDDLIMCLDTEKTFFGIQVPEPQLPTEITGSKSCNVPGALGESCDPVRVLIHTGNERVCKYFVDFSPYDSPLILSCLKS